MQKSLLEHIETKEKEHFVYIAKHRRRFAIEMKSEQVIFKIGYTSNPDSRERSAKTFAPFGVVFKYFEFFDEKQARSFERIAHREFEDYGIVDNEGGVEWFMAPKHIFQKSIQMLEEGGTPRYSVWQIVKKLLRKRWRNSWIFKMIT